VKRSLLGLHHRLGLLLPVYRGYEALRGRSGASSDGLPLPPARFRLMVGETPGAIPSPQDLVLLRIKPS